MKHISQIRPSSWDVSKTEAINMQNDFIWIDDYIFEYERVILRQNAKENSFRIVNLKKEKELFNLKNNIKTINLLYIQTDYINDY